MKRMLFLIFISSLFVLIGCNDEPSEKVLRYQENNEIIGPEKDEIIGDISDTIYDSIDRSNAKATEIFIHPVEAPGEQVIPPEGRYTIGPSMNADGSHTMQSGRVVVYDEDEALLIEEVLMEFGNVTVDLNGSHTVHVDGFTQAILTPVDTKMSNELYPGIWEVGKDIEAGNYSIHAEYGFGDLEIFEEGLPPRLFEILNTTPESMIDIQLKDGQKLKITGVGIQFEPQS